MAKRRQFDREVLAAIAVTGLISLASLTAAILSFRMAIHRGEAKRSKRAADLVLCHELAEKLERKLAKSRSFILTGDEAFAQETEDARSEFREILGDLHRGVTAVPAEGLLSDISALESRHHAVLRDVMRLRRSGASPRALTPQLTDRLKPFRDELDGKIRSLIELQESRLRDSDEAAESSVRFAMRVSSAAGIFSFAALLVVLWLVWRLARAQLEVEQALRRSKAELDAVVEERTRELESFSYSVAHDLRTPLRAITNYGELAAGRARIAGDPAIEQNVERMRAAGLRMSHLIDSLLWLSRLTRRPFIPERVDLSSLAAEVGAEIAAGEPGRNVELVVRPGLSVEGDRDLLRAAVRNLLENAWKFTRGRPDARVEFGGEAVDGVSWYFVRDNGAGFDERFAGKLFTAFERLHSAKEFPGTGIGLATVERVVRRHGGSVRAKGRLAEGATFYFSLGSDAR